MAHAAINGQSIYFEDSGGDGRPVVLAHGFLMDHEMGTIIIDDASHSATWIAKWQQRDKEAFAEPYQCLTTRDDITDRLGEITCPALVIHGTSDTAITIDRAEILAAGLVGAGEMVRVDGAHAANMTNPEPVNAAIVDFLAGLAA